MKSSVSKFIQDHDETLAKAVFDKDFLAFHLTQIKFLQHERLIHLLVTLFISFCLLTFLVLFLFLNLFWFLIVFVILVALTIFYFFHYYKLENTVIRWYFIYNKKYKKN